MRSCSVVQCVRCLTGQPLYCSEGSAGVRGERGYGDSSTHYALLSSITLLPRLPRFPPQAFPITISSLTSPPSISLQSTAALILRSIYAPQTPSCCAFQGILIPVWGMHGCGKDCLILIPFRLPQSAVSLSAFSVSPLTQTIALMWGSGLCFCSPTHSGKVQSY